MAIIDYGMGNLRSVQKAFEHIGAQAIIAAEAHVIDQAPAVVLPGVGAFGDAMNNLRRAGLDAAIHRAVEAGKPFLGICLGQQLMFETSQEMGQHRGLEIFHGHVRRFPDGKLKVPHIGWNQIHIQRDDPLLAGVVPESFAYFVHSYYVEPEEEDVVLATTDYGIDFASIVGQDRVWGIQFHPEKSQDVGLRILENFVRAVEGD
ncbi:MAG: imidazole glycerol phosphate synthase subunit HisH [Anaerolineae bacterium]